MNKKVSKALAAVLSAAMAASAFAMSTSASFAATAAGSPVTFKVADIQYNLTTNSTDATTPVDMDGSGTTDSDLVSVAAFKNAITAEKDGQTLTITSIAPIEGEEWSSSNTKLATIGGKTGQISIVKKDITARQEVVFTRKYKVTVAPDSYQNNEHGVQGGGDTATVTFRVVTSIYPNGSLMVLSTDANTATANTEIETLSNKKVSINEEPTFNVYKATANPGSAASFTAVNGVNYEYSISGNLTTITSASGIGTVTAQDPENVKTGTATITATNPSNEDEEIQAASVTVEKSYAFDTRDDLSVNTQYGEERATLAEDNSLSKTYDVTGMDIDASVALTLDDGETVGQYYWWRRHC